MALGRLMMRGKGVPQKGNDFSHQYIVDVPGPGLLECDRSGEQKAIAPATSKWFVITKEKLINLISF